MCQLDARLRLIWWNREIVIQLGDQYEQMEVFRRDGLTSILKFWSGDSKVRTMTFRVIYCDLLDHRSIADPQCVECPDDYFPASNPQP